MARSTTIELKLIFLMSGALERVQWLLYDRVGRKLRIGQADGPKDGQ